MSAGCECPVPRPRPYDPGSCRDCGRIISPAWTPSDFNFETFFGRLSALPGVVPAFVFQCRTRELAGRDVFGFRFCDRDNAAEGQEEAADLALYAHLHILRARREGRTEQLELALTAAHHAAMAWVALEQLKRP